MRNIKVLLQFPLIVTYIHISFWCRYLPDAIHSHRYLSFQKGNWESRGLSLCQRKKGRKRKKEKEEETQSK